MNRRNLIKTLGISAVGLATVPFWIDGWSEDGLPSTESRMSKLQRKTLAEVVETILPASDIPGAKDLKIDLFVETMINDCYETGVQEDFYNGITEIEQLSQEKFSNSFYEIPQEDKLALLESFPVIQKPDGSEFSLVPIVKNLTIFGFVTSRFYMENILPYELVPARYHGSFPVDQTIYKNT